MFKVWFVLRTVLFVCVPGEGSAASVCQGERDGPISARGHGQMRCGAECVGSQSAERVAQCAVSGRSDAGVCVCVAGELNEMQWMKE